MCGITGFWQLNDFAAEGARVTATQMAEKIAYRGPDDCGVWLDDKAGVALAHRRLSIVDLSPAGHQPMLSASGRYVMVFNGEIYNHLDLRRELDNTGLLRYARNDDPDVSSRSPEGRGDPVAWRGHSDTETLLAGFEAWGIEVTLKKTVGMFAIALWDCDEKVLTLARDRVGEKPLYYGFQNNTFLFGSELKALKAHPDFNAEIDRDVICLYLRHCYIPAPYSIYKGIKKLLPGTYLQLPLGGEIDVLHTSKPKVYWTLIEGAQQAITMPFVGSDADAIAALDTQLKQSIGLQMMADVPLGAFLSGGVDSSAVIALMQAQSARPIKTFTIGFAENGFDEAVYAKKVAQHLGTDHTELYVSSRDAMDVIPQLGRMYDEPFADSSQIPTFLVSKMAKSHVTVSLSGDAGDELFCGYNRYMLANTWEQVVRIPFGFRKMAGRLIKAIPPTAWDAVFQQLNKLKTLPPDMGGKLDKLASRLVTVDGANELYYSLVSELEHPEEVVVGGQEPATWLTEAGMRSTFGDAKLHMMLMDTMTYLPDDILVKVDRAAMANSLETRVPFLDHRVVELAWRLPMSMKVRNGSSKWILRQVLYQYVPKDLIERPKAGFGIPLADWLRGPLKGWVEDMLDEVRLRQEGFFNHKIIRTKWDEHLSGKFNHMSLLWSVLMFQSWLDEE